MWQSVYLTSGAMMRVHKPPSLLHPVASLQTVQNLQTTSDSLAPLPSDSLAPLPSDSLAASRRRHHIPE